MSKIDMEKILSEKEFDELSNSTKKGLIELSRNIEGKSSNDAMKLIGNFYNTTLKKEKMTSANKKALYLAITSNLDSKTKQQFDMLYNMVISKI